MHDELYLDALRAERLARDLARDLDGLGQVGHLRAAPLRLSGLAAAAAAHLVRVRVRGRGRGRDRGRVRARARVRVRVRAWDL